MHLYRHSSPRRAGAWTGLLGATTALLLISGHATGSTPPEALIAGMTEEVLAKTAQLQGAINPSTIHDVVETAIMPNVDFRGMTARAVGPRWRAATDAQKEQLMAGFEALLIKTYAGAFAQTAGAKFKLKSSVAVDATTREVRSEVALREGGDPVLLNYRMALQGDVWRVTDVGVMGVWLVPTYQSQFAQVLQNSDVTALIQLLAEKTRAH
jgi:phospholipid transport system substrate-binding protein